MPAWRERSTRYKAGVQKPSRFEPIDRVDANGGIGASRPLRRFPAIVSFLNPQPALSLVGGNRSSCPRTDLAQMERARKGGGHGAHGAEHHSFTGVRMGAPLPFSSTTTNLAGSVLLALRPTT